MEKMKFVLLEDARRAVLNANSKFVWCIDNLPVFTLGKNVEMVVRCGFCKHWEEIEETEGAGYCHHPRWNLVGHEPPFAQFAGFCSYGEKAQSKQKNETKCVD